MLMCGVFNLTARAGSTAALLVPVPGQHLADDPHRPEEGDPEADAEEQRTHHQIDLEICAVHVEEPPEPGRPLAEEELADDRADDGESSRDAKADEDVGNGVRELEL